MVYQVKTSSFYFFYKSVLRKVSFDANLFAKELKKALTVLSKQEGARLLKWALAFSRSQPELYSSLQLLS
tara:strand:- start:455 stop:664 length:210 start_codon:yes stop_codon:yes gene_type:complete